jgi:O-antigen ligase
MAVIAGPSVADIVCSTVAALFLLRSAGRHDFTWLRQDWLLAALALWAYLCIRALFVADVEAALGLALPFVRYPIYAVALQTLVLRETIWRSRLVGVALVSVGFLALDSILQFVAGQDVLGHPPYGDRLVAIYRHPWVGTIIAWQFMPVTLRLVDQKRYWLAAGFGVLCSVAIVLSGDRMALLFSLLAIGLLVLIFRRTWRALLIGAPIALLIMGAILYLNPRVYQRQVASTVETISNLPRTHYGVIWTSALKIGAHHPVFGVGPLAYRTVCLDPTFGPLYPYDPQEMRCATHPHNFYLEWLVDGGSIGLGLFVLAMVLLLRSLLSGIRTEPADWTYAGLLVTILARLWPIASSTSFHHAWSAVPFWLVVGWALSYRASGPVDQTALKHPPG